MEFLSTSQHQQLASVFKHVFIPYKLVFLQIGNHNILPGPLKSCLITDLERLKDHLILSKRSSY